MFIELSPPYYPPAHLELTSPVEGDFGKGTYIRSGSVAHIPSMSQALGSICSTLGKQVNSVPEVL